MYSDYKLSFCLFVKCLPLTPQKLDIYEIVIHDVLTDITADIANISSGKVGSQYKM